MERWDSWRTASWSKASHTYILTGLSVSAFVKKFRKNFEDYVDTGGKAQTHRLSL